MSPYFCAFLLALLVSVLVTPVVRDVAIRRGWVTLPSLARHVHREPIPRIGGVAIYVGTLLVAVVVTAVLFRTDTSLAHRALQGFVPIFLAGTLIFVVGLIDDFRNLRARTKLAAQILAAVMLYGSGLRISHFDALYAKGTLNPFLGLPLTVVWVIAITNAFNLIDGLDGLAAGSAFFSTLIVLAVSSFERMPFIAMIVTALAGSILGFLRYNFNPASIFLGDSGSLFIGFVLAAAALAGSGKAPTMIAVAVPVVSFGLPILDVSIAILRRFLRGRSLFEPDAEHIHHKLLKRGFSHRHAVLILYGVSALFGVLSLMLYPSGRLIILVLAAISVGVFFGLQKLRYHEFTELQRVAERAINQKRIIANNLAIRHASEALESCKKFNEIGEVVWKYLQPTGFDGFVIMGPGLEEVPDAELAPFSRVYPGVAQLGSAALDSISLRLEFRLSPADEENSRAFCLLQGCCEEPLWLDPNVFASSGFTTALDAALLRALGSLQQVNKFKGAVENAAICEAVPLLAND